MINKIFNNVFQTIGAMSLLALIVAYLAEILGKLNPCMLCVYQRIPYIILCIFALFALVFTSKKKLCKILIPIFLLIEIAFAFYHVGVEHYIFEESHICQFKTTATSSIVTTKIAGNCSDIYFRFMNLSMAEWNLIYAIIMLSYFIYREKND